MISGDVDLQKLDMSALQSTMGRASGSSSLCDGSMTMNEGLLVGGASLGFVAILGVVTALLSVAAVDNVVVRHNGGGWRLVSVTV
jgi:hypothetical protein